MASDNIWSKIGKFLKTTFSGGRHWDKENGWQSISDYVAENPEASNIASSFNGVGGNSSKNGLLGNLFNKFTGGGLTDAESQMNDFNASQAEADRAFQSYEAALQREWSAQEAERARDWQEEMHIKYNSLSGKIAQAEQAGVNPMLAVTGNAVSPMSATSPVPSGASPSGSRASGGGFAHQSFTELIGMVLGLVKAKSEIELTQSETAVNRAEETRINTENTWIDQLSQAQLENLVASKEELESRLGVNSETANKLKAEFGKLNQEAARIGQITSAEKRNLEAQAALAEFHSSTDGLFKSLDLGNDVLNMIADIALALIENKTKKSIAGIK